MTRKSTKTIDICNFDPTQGGRNEPNKKNLVSLYVKPCFCFVVGCFWCCWFLVCFFEIGCFYVAQLDWNLLCSPSGLKPVFLLPQPPRC